MGDQMTIDDWTIANDRLSVTVGINTRLWDLRRKKLKPAIIRLGREHSLLFWKERGVSYIPSGPLKLISGDVFWDEEHKRWCYSKRHIPMQFNDPKIVGIAVESVPNDYPSPNSGK